VPGVHHAKLFAPSSNVLRVIELSPEETASSSTHKASKVSLSTRTSPERCWRTRSTPLSRCPLEFSWKSEPHLFGKHCDPSHCSSSFLPLLDSMTEDGKQAPAEIFEVELYNNRITCISDTLVQNSSESIPWSNICGIALTLMGVVCIGTCRYRLS